MLQHIAITFNMKQAQSNHLLGKRTITFSWHTQYPLFFGQKLFREHTPMLRYTYIACLIVILQVLFSFIDLTWGFRVSEKLLSVTMESECLRLKTECEIFFPPLIIWRCIAVKHLKPFFSNKAVNCCYNTEPEYEKLLDWYWLGQIAAFPEMATHSTIMSTTNLTVPVLGSNMNLHSEKPTTNSMSNVTDCSAFQGLILGWGIQSRTIC